jgi:hypothetical protein
MITFHRCLVHRICEGDMGGIQVRDSAGLALTGVGGIALFGNLLAKFTDFRVALTAAFTKRKDGIPWGDVLLAYTASVATGKSDYEALRPWHGKSWVAKALRISTVASPETVRQHLDNLADGHGEEAMELVGQASLDLLARSKATFTPCSSGHVTLDVDTTPQENGKTRKEGVSRTYMTGVDGFCSAFAFAGLEGWCINEEFRPGKQHSQKGTPAFLRTSIHRLNSLGIGRILARLDAAFDASACGGRGRISSSKAIWRTFAGRTGRQRSRPCRSGPGPVFLETFAWPTSAASRPAASKGRKSRSGAC